MRSGGVILVIGDLMLDVLLTAPLLHEEQSAGIAARGGGSAANTAAWIAWAGESVEFVGCTGEDVIGGALGAELEAHNVHTRLRTVPGAETGCVAVEVTPRGERLMRSSRAANEFICADDVVWRHSEPLRHIHLTGYALLGPNGSSVLRAAGHLAREYRCTLSLDPSSTGVIEGLGAGHVCDLIRDAGVSVLLPNADEARLLSETSEIERAAQHLTRVAPMVVVKIGPRGAVWSVSTPGHIGEPAANVVPVESATLVDTTGAGDAFNAGLLVGMLKGQTLMESCRLGNLLAGRAISRLGGRPAPNSAFWQQS